MPICKTLFYEDITLGQHGATNLKAFTVFSRVHATLQPAFSVGPSVGRSVGWLVGRSVGFDTTFKKVPKMIYAPFDCLLNQLGV